jgi:protein-disulfide isomerase
MTDRHPGSRPRTPFEVLGLVVAFGSALLGCASTRPQTAVAVQGLAEVDGYAITAEQVTKSVGVPLARLEDQVYALKRQSIVALIDERLLMQAATQRGITVQELLNAEVIGKVDPVTAEEVDATYSAVKAQVQGDEANARQQVRALLEDRKLAARRQAFLSALRAKAQIVVSLKPPPAFKPEIATDRSPYRGRRDARVTIVEFQDFHCPFCRQVQPVLAQVIERYGDRVKLVYRDFPIDQLHPQARKAHEAARCANDQGRFWTYHDVLYANPPKAAPEDLLFYAKEAHLDVDAFERCAKTRAHRAGVQRDIDDGIRAGVTGTPTFFVNDQQLSGAQALETFTRVIDEELAKVH